MSIESFTRAYIEAALWSSTDNSTESGGEPLDKNYSASDIAADSMLTLTKDCRAFYESNSETWTDAGMSDDQAGHDFWLTRNRHGAGFWDRGIGEAGERLTDAAHAWGEVDIYVGDDGRLYHS